QGAGYRAWPAHRQEDRRRAWRKPYPDRCAGPRRRNGRNPTPAGTQPRARETEKTQTRERRGRNDMSDILIVDDERDIRELIADILKDEGFQTRVAANSDEAVAALNEQEPALMVLDIWLKDSRMDGIDILKQVKHNNPDVPVIIISGHGNIEIAVAAIRQGAYDFIEKPFNIDQLTVVVARAMETSRLRRENHELRRRDTTSTEAIGSSPAFK